MFKKTIQVALTFEPSNRKKDISQKKTKSMILNIFRTQAHEGQFDINVLLM